MLALRQSGRRVYGNSILSAAFVYLKLFLIKDSLKRCYLGGQKEPCASISLTLTVSQMEVSPLLHTYYTFCANRLSCVLRVWSCPLTAEEKGQHDASWIEILVQMPVWLETRLLCELSQVPSISVCSFYLITALQKRQQCLPFTLWEKPEGLNANLDIILTACYIHNTEYLYPLFGGGSLRQ